MGEDTAIWVPPPVAGTYWIRAHVQQEFNGVKYYDTDSAAVTVVSPFPAVPSNPSPADGATNVNYENLTLSWSCSDPDPNDTLTYYVCIGFDSLNLYLAYTDLLSPSANMGTLASGSTWFWKVVVYDLAAHQTDGPVWRFTTAGYLKDTTVIGEVSNIDLIRKNELLFYVDVDSMYSEEFLIKDRLKILCKVKIDNEALTELYKELKPGQLIKVNGYYYKGRQKRNPGEFDYNAYLQSKEIIGIIAISD